jgi:hypothetical protein
LGGARGSCRPSGISGDEFAYQGSSSRPKMKTGCLRLLDEPRDDGSAPSRNHRTTNS